MLDLLNAGMVGFAVAGAFLSATYYPHMYVLTALLISARIFASRAGGLIPLGRLDEYQNDAEYGTAPANPAKPEVIGCMHERSKRLPGQDRMDFGELPRAPGGGGCQDSYVRGI